MRPNGVTRAEAAEALGVPPNRINQWVSDGAPVLHRGGQRGQPSTYDVEALRAWHEARQQDNADALSLEEERAKLARAQRLKIEREGRVRVGELLERTNVEAESEALLTALRTRFLQVPRQLAQAGQITREQEPAVTAAVHEALRELATWKWSPPESAPPVPDELDEDPGDEGDEAA